MKDVIQKILPILIILGIILLVWWIATKRRAKGGFTPGYQFFRWKDSTGGDIDQLEEYVGNVPALKQACDEHPECVAFNTAGYLKRKVDPTNFTEKTGYPDWYGLYVKRKTLR